MRTADRCALSILRAFPKADYYVHAVFDQDAWMAELFKPVRLVVEPQFEMPERKEYSQQLGGRCHGVQRVLKQLDGLKKTWEVYANSGHTHDIVIRCRPDLSLTTMPDQLALDGYDALIPTFSNFRGYNDRLAIMSHVCAEAYFCRFDRLDEYINKGGVFHPERFLKWSLAGFRIGRTSTCFFCLRKDGTRDEPLWNPKAGDIVL